MESDQHDRALTRQPHGLIRNCHMEAMNWTMKVIFQKLFFGHED